jgi:hypothetical protein
MQHFLHWSPLTARWDFQLCRAHRKDGGADFSFSLISRGSFRIGSVVLSAGQAPTARVTQSCQPHSPPLRDFLIGDVEVLGRNEGSTTRIGVERVENREDGGEDVEMPGPEAPANN